MGAAMSKWLEAAKRTTGQEAMQPTQPVKSVNSVLFEGVAPQPQPAKEKPQETFPYGMACGMGDMPRTWTGRVVSLADWRNLTDWERNGPKGMLWCGKRKQWVPT